ncbi:MAG: hypothetical protein IPK28_17520 [Devosia sp.]|nr:hypothetical protein [Devosia sp.]
MRTGLTVSAIAHAGLIALAIVGLGVGRPIETPPVESIAVELVPVSEFSNIRLGSLESEIVETETPSAVDADKPAELAQPTGNTTEDQPTPQDTPEPSPAPTLETAPAPDLPEPEPEPEPVPEPEAAPVPVTRSEPEPEPEIEPAPEPVVPVAPIVTPVETPDPTDAAPRPRARTAALEQKRAEFKTQQDAAKKKAAEDKKKAEDAKKAADKKKADEQKRIEQAKADEPLDLTDELANIINNEESRGSTTGDGGEKTLGRQDGRSATLSQSEIGALIAQIRDCIALPAGAEEADARAEFVFTIGADGMVVGRPQMTSSPANAIETTYAGAISRALIRCGPFTMAAGQDVRAQFAARAF